MLYALTCIGFLLLASLVSLPLRRGSVSIRLLAAFLAWATTLLAFALAKNQADAASWLAWVMHVDQPEAWIQPYLAASGAFLGVGARWWSPAWWRHPLHFANDFEFRFAAKISFRPERSISNLVVRLGILSIMVGVAVMLVAVSIVFGFERAIQDKVIGFGAHIRIGNLLEELESEVVPLPRYNEFVPAIQQLEGVAAVTPYIQKTAMMRSGTTQEGVMVKGVDSTYDWRFFEKALVQGKVPDVTLGSRYSRELLISQKLTTLLDTKLGEKILLYFFDPQEGKARVREFDVVGIYETGLGEFDQMNILCDIRVPQEIWRWDPDQVMGFEVRLDGQDVIERLEPTAEKIESLMPYNYEANTITSEYPELFEWVALQHQNVWFILFLMVLIAMINMASVILVLVLERTRTIGLLKAIGLGLGRIREIFVSNAFFLVLVGLALGNLMGLSLILSQDLFGWLTVDQDSYFVKVVPVMWKWDWFVHLNFGVMALCTLFMYVPSYLVTRISAVKALRFD
jgi:lipoprotein-releasing system permease protein